LAWRFLIHQKNSTLAQLLWNEVAKFSYIDSNASLSPLLCVVLDDFERVSARARMVLCASEDASPCDRVEPCIKMSCSFHIGLTRAD
jgi:hypothetical protein